MKAAQFCDALSHFYASATTGPAAMFAHFMPVGLADGPPPVGSPVFGKLAEPAYANSIKSINDTADGPTLIRNVLEAQQDGNAAIVLSGPPTDLVRLLALYGAKEWIARKVRLLCVAETGAQPDAAAEKLFSEWPSPVVTVGRDIGEALPFPGASIDKDFAYTPANPLVDAYRAYQPMPYDAPSWAMAAMLYAAHPSDGYFKLSGAGQRTRLIFDPEQKDRILKAYVELASAKPVPRKPPKRPDDKKDDKKDEEKDKKKKEDAAQ